MVMTHFVIAGKRVECIARLDEGMPVYDLFVNGEEIAGGVGHKMLLEVCETVRDELQQLTTYWQDVGRQICEFDETWRKRMEEVSANDQQESSGACGCDA